MNRQRDYGSAENLGHLAGGDKDKPELPSPGPRPTLPDPGDPPDRRGQPHDPPPSEPAPKSPQPPPTR